MTTIKIAYQLAEAGRKAEILAGRPGHCDRTVEVEVTPELLAAATVDHTGAASYSLDKRRGSQCLAYSYDSVLTPETAAAEMLRVEAGLAAADAARAEATKRERLEQAERALAMWRAEAAEALAGNHSHRAWRSNEGRVAIVRNPGTRIEHTIYSDHCGLSADELSAFWEDYQPVASRHAEADRLAEERERETEKAKAEKAAAAIAERDAWITAHGSDRLRKGLAAGMIAKLGAVYREERVAVDFGSDWRPWDADEDSDRLNPTEAELDALLDARRRWRDAALECQLRTVRKSAGEYEEEEPAGEWSPALMVRLPWDRYRWAIRYL